VTGGSRPNGRMAMWRISLRSPARSRQTNGSPRGSRPGWMIAGTAMRPACRQCRAPRPEADRTLFFLRLDLLLLLRDLPGDIRHHLCLVEASQDGVEVGLRRIRELMEARGHADKLLAGSRIGGGLRLGKATCGLAAEAFGSVCHDRLAERHLADRYAGCQCL